VWEDKAVLEFFETSGRNLMAAEKAAGVKHHLALSIVGSDRSPDSGYLRAKVAQENLIKASGIPYTILRSTQFFEFVVEYPPGAVEQHPSARRVRLRLCAGRDDRRRGQGQQGNHTDPRTDIV
jgi:uncharacterized protein YbjT (DUF2867 family)